MNQKNSISEISGRKNYQYISKAFISYKKYQPILLVLAAIVLNILLVNKIYAQPIIKFQVIPDVQDIVLGSQESEGVLIRALSNKRILKYIWKIKGPGYFKKESRPTDSAVIYVAPDEIIGTSIKVTITVEVTDENNIMASDDNIFTLLAPPPTPTQKPTVTPVITPTATPSTTPTITPTQTPSMIEQLLEQADRYFEKKWFLTSPKETTAFDLYQEVLDLDPDNLHAREKLREMTEQYKEWGDNAVKQGNKAKAQTYYERYLEVAEYYQAKFPEGYIGEEIKVVKEQLKELESPPTPTPTVGPTPQPAKEVQQLLTQADEAFERGHFLIAYDLYYEVLNLELTNRYARQKMYDIAYKYTLEDPTQGQELASDLRTLSMHHLVAKMEGYQSSDSKNCSDLEDILYMLKYIKDVLHGLFDPGKPEIEQEIMRINNYIQEFEQQYANLCK